ncbi:MAG: hypothetical protein ACOYWZ_20200 [Bacillota bacterium]
MVKKYLPYETPTVEQPYIGLWPLFKTIPKSEISKEFQPFGGYAGFSPNWQRISSQLGQRAAITGLESSQNQLYGLLTGHFDVATKAAMESRRLWEEKKLAYEQYELQKEALKQQKEAAGGTVICSELYRQGYLSKEILIKDHIYRLFYIDDETYQGYRLWADRIVNMMRNSKFITKIIKPFCIAWAYEAANQIDSKVKGHWMGKILMKIGIPICRNLGKQIRKVCYGL